MQNLIIGTGIENAQKIIFKFRKDLNIKIFSKENLLLCFKKWVKLKNKLKPIKPYLLNNMTYWFCSAVIDLGIIKTKSSIFKSDLKKLTNKIARKLFTKKLHVSKRAEIFKMKEVHQIYEELIKGNNMSQAAAVMLKITFLSGCRAGDTKSCYWEDIKKIKGEKGEFLHLPMRFSKTNPRGLRKEFITIELSKNSNWNIEKILVKFKNHLIKNNILKNSIFPDKPTKSYVYYFERACKKLGFKRKLTGHSGRNSTILRLFQAGVKTEDICIQMHWRRNTEMVFLYRDVLLETTSIGAPHMLNAFDEKFNF
jgi:hypothetical protein